MRPLDIGAAAAIAARIGFMNSTTLTFIHVLVLLQRNDAEADDRDVLLRIAGQNHPWPANVLLFVIADHAKT